MRRVRLAASPRRLSVPQEQCGDNCRGCTGGTSAGEAGSVGGLRLAGVWRSRFLLVTVLTLAVALVAGGAAAVLTGVVTVSWAGQGASAAASTPELGAPLALRTAAPAPARPPAAPVLRPITASAKVPTAAGLARALAGVMGPGSLGPRASIAVRDVTSGKLLYGKNAAAAMMPASTTKLLTSTAVLADLGPQHRFTTTVVEGSKPGQIVLVGGGDPMLATAAGLASPAAKSKGYPTPATVEGLAARTAKQLRASGRTSVSVLVDDSLFTEPVNPAWEPQYVPTGVVGHISALWVDEDRDSWPSRLPRAKDPAMSAARAFVAALRRNHVGVSGEPLHGKAPAGAKRIASVASPTLSDIVEHVLLISDNDGAEILARQVAVAEHRPATFAGAAGAIRSVLGRLGVAGGQINLHDGSGLSRKGRLSADVLSQTLATAARPEFPDLRAAVTGMPIAGYTGSLASRFYDDASAPGVGLVQAKTGTLSGVQTLAGIATTKDGAVLAFAVMSNGAGATDPRPGLDRAAAVLAGCGCR